MKKESGKKILLLGSGLVAAPLVRYLLKEGFNLTVADMFVDKAKALVGNAANGKAISLNVEDIPSLREEIKKVEVVISLLPATKHLDVANICLEEGRHLFTTSYVKPPMKALEAKVLDKGLLFMNEVGLDPGVDHMSAMRIFDKIWDKGGKVISFKSYCGGLPAPDANTNPWGYKFSWSPKGVILAAKNNAKYKKDGKIVDVVSENLFKDIHTLNISGLCAFEAYPNRNSIDYIDIYNLKDIETMYRGTLRNKGWCETWSLIPKIGLLSEAEENGLKGVTWAKFMSRLIRTDSEKTIKKDLASFLGIKEKSHPIEWFDWLGLFSNEKLKVDKSAPIDLFAEKMLEKCSYSKGERDMVVLYHEFIADYSGKKEKITSTLVDYGIPNGDSSMSRIVGLTCAISAKLFLDGKITAKGVRIPVSKDIYGPVLDELEKQGIKFVEKAKSGVALP